LRIADFKTAAAGSEIRNSQYSILNTQAGWVGSCGEVASTSFTSAPGGAFTGPCNSGSLVERIHRSMRPGISSNTSLAVVKVAESIADGQLDKT